MLEIFKMMGVIAIDKEQALRDISAVQRETEKSTKEMSSSFSKFTADHKAAFRAVGIAAAAAGTVIALALKKVGNSFDIYETALVDMGKITDESLESIENRMKKLPPILGSLTDLTRGYYQIVSAGIREPIEAIDTLTVSAQTASAAHVDQAEVVKGLTKIMAGYQGQIKDVSEAADLMFAIEKEGQTTVAEMIPLIGGLATVSSNLKISQDEMGASMAVITRTAGSTAEAATEFEGVLMALMKPTEQMIALINKMGFETASLAIEELGFVEVLRRVKEAAGDNEIVLGELFGRKQAIMGVTKLTANGMDTLTTAIDSVATKIGMASRAYGEWADTGEAFNKEQKAVTENLLILIGQAIDPMMDTIQRRLIETVKIMSEWIAKNEEMAASIGMWTGGIGMLLIPLGALIALLPSLVAGFGIIAGWVTALSLKFALLAGSLGLAPAALALAIIGFAKLGWEIGKAWKEATSGPSWKEIGEMGVQAADAQTAALEKLRIAYHLTNEDLEYFKENHELSAEAIKKHKEIMEELEVADYKFMHTQGKVVESIKEVVKTFENLDTAVLNSVITGKELTEQQEEYMAMRQRMSDIDRTATQKKIDDLDMESAALIANMNVNLLTMEQIDEYRKVMYDNIIRESSERQEHLTNMIEIEDKLFELSHTQTEIKIRDLDNITTARVDAAKQAMLSAEEEEAAMVKIKEIYDKEIASILELAIARSEGEIETLEKAIELRKEAGEAIDELIKKRNEEVANLNGLKEAYSGTAAAAEKLAIAEAKHKPPELVGAAVAGQYKVLNSEGGYEGVTSDPNALTAAEIAAGWSLVPLAQMMKGGLVKSLIESLKHFAAGGGIGTDTVPIMATPGEYIIKKQMVDFIRRTGMVTGGLVKAIQKGMPTPSPEFAGGGMVGRWTGAQLDVVSGGMPGGSLIFGKESIIINAKTLDDDTINQAGDKIMRVVTDKARAAGLKWGTS